MMKYHQAADVCQHEGGDLIRLDSLTKHNIMRSFVGKYLYFQFFFNFMTISFPKESILLNNGFYEVNISPSITQSSYIIDNIWGYFNLF